MNDPGPKPRTIIITLISAGVIAALAWVSFRTDPVLVDLSPVTLGPMQVTIDVDGRTRVRDLYEIAAPITGLARRSPVAVGDPVTEGETVVAIIEPATSNLLDARSRLQANAQVSEAEAALHVAETELSQAEREREHAQAQFDRSKSLVERGVATITQLEEADRDLTMARAAVDAAHARIDMADGALDRAKAALTEPDGSETDPGACCMPILAPATGVVLSVDAISARPVTAGARLATIGNPDDLEIVADLLSADAVKLGPGAVAKVERWGGDPPLDARLRRIEPKARTVVSTLGIEEQRVDALFDLISPVAARPGLGDNFAVFLRIVEWQTPETLQIPISATFRSGDGWAVFVADGGVARLQPVTLGRRGTRVVQVLGGLEAGELVVTHPSDDLADGRKIAERP